MEKAINVKQMIDSQQVFIPTITSKLQAAGYPLKINGMTIADNP
jgi:hypothetical protein